jgi:hypothetical protein
MIDPQVDIYLHRAASLAASHVHARIRDTSVARDPDIETGSVDINGNLLPAQSHTPIPAGGYDWAPAVLALKPDIEVDERVLFIWADSGRNRRPYIVAVLGTVHPMGETAVINADGTLTTASGRAVAAVDWARTTATSATLNGHTVVLVWADDGGLRRAYAVIEV